MSVQDSMIFESIWKIGDCTGPPLVMSLYNTMNIASPFLSITTNEFTPPKCGLNPLKIYSGCCSSSLDSESSLGYQSWSTQSVGYLDLTLSPESANGFQYCLMNSINNQSLYSYASVLLLADSGCTFGGIKCFSNGDIYVYQTQDCSGPFFNSNINQQPYLQTEIIGNVSAQMVTATNGSLVYTWTAYVPEYMDVPSKFPKLLAIEYCSFCLSYIASLFALTRAMYSLYSLQSTE